MAPYWISGHRYKNLPFGHIKNQMARKRAAIRYRYKIARSMIRANYRGAGRAYHVRTIRSYMTLPRRRY